MARIYLIKKLDSIQTKVLSLEEMDCFPQEMEKSRKTGHKSTRLC